MSQQRPTTAELVEAVREFLDHEVRPRLEGHAAFHARVAVNVLGMVQRELEEGPRLEAEAQVRLAALLGRQGSIDELSRELCVRIRSGELGLDNPQLVEHLWKTTRGKIAIDNPRYKALGD